MLKQPKQNTTKQNTKKQNKIKQTENPQPPRKTWCHHCHHRYCHCLVALVPPGKAKKNWDKIGESTPNLGVLPKTIYGCFLKWWVFHPNHPLNNRVFHYFRHPFWGTSIFGNAHVWRYFKWIYEVHVKCCFKTASWNVFWHASLTKNFPLNKKNP